MPTIQLSDPLYEAAVQRASEAGFDTVEEFVADAVAQRLDEMSTEEPDSFFTPRIIEKLDRAAAQADAGEFVTFEELNARIEAKQEAWLANPAS